MDSPKEMFASRNVVTKYAKRARERQGKIIEGKMMGGMESEGTVLHAATNKTPSCAAPNSEVLKGRNTQPRAGSARTPPWVAIPKMNLP